MTLDTTQITVGSTQVLVETTVGVPTSFMIKNLGSVPVYFGPTGVSVEDGEVLWPGGEFPQHYLSAQVAGETIYAITPPGISGRIAILEAG